MTAHQLARLRIVAVLREPIGRLRSQFDHFCVARADPECSWLIPSRRPLNRSDFGRWASRLEAVADKTCRRLWTLPPVVSSAADAAEERASQSVAESRRASQTRVLQWVHRARLEWLGCSHLFDWRQIWANQALAIGLYAVQLLHWGHVLGRQARLLVLNHEQLVQEATQGAALRHIAAHLGVRPPEGEELRLKVLNPRSTDGDTAQGASSATEMPCSLRDRLTERYQPFTRALPAVVLKVAPRGETLEQHESSMTWRIHPRCR